MENIKDQDFSDEEEEIIPDYLIPSVVLPPLTFECSLNSHLVRITHIDSPSNFYVMLEDKIQYYETYSKSINDFYANDNIPPTVNELPIGSYWCVKVNGNWNRAKIISNIGKLSHKLGEKAVPFYRVFLVDSGVVMNLYLDQLRTLDDRFATDEPMAIPCMLSDVYPLTQLEDNNWSIDATQIFSELCSDQLYIAIIWSRKISLHYEVILETLPKTTEDEKNPTINELLVFGGFATSTLLDKVIEDDLQNNIIETVAEGDIVRENNVEKEKVHSSDVDKNDPLSTWEPMMEHHKESETLMNDEDAENYFLGYKNDDAKNICAYVRYQKPCPRGDNCKWLHTEPRDDGLPSGSDNIFTDLKCPPICLEEGDMYSAVVLTATSPSIFYAIFDKDDLSNMDILSEIQRNLAETYKHEPIKSNQTIPALGELMVLHETDGGMPGYYRIRVIEVSQKDLGVLVKVVYIDYGKQEWVKECQLRSIFECFLYTPAQALECYVFGVRPNNDNWDNNSKECFFDLVDRKVATVTVLDADCANGRYGLEIEVDDEVNVNSTLTDRGFAFDDSF